MIYEYWLEGFGHSKRAVRYRALSPDELERVAKEAAVSGAGMTAVAYQIAYQTLGTRRMLIAITEPLKTIPQAPVPQPPDADGKPQPDLVLPDLPPDLDEKSIWKPVDPTVLEVSFGNGKLFTAKDVRLLGIFFDGLHEVHVRDAQAAMGKVRSLET